MCFLLLRVCIYLVGGGRKFDTYFKKSSPNND